MVVGHDLYEMGLKFRQPLEMGLLSAGWIQFGHVSLAERYLYGLAFEFLEPIETG